MIRDLKNLYTAVVDSKVVLFDTNLSSFVERLNTLYDNTRNYDYYYRQFKKESYLSFTKGGQTIYLQKVY